MFHQQHFPCIVPSWQASLVDFTMTITTRSNCRYNQEMAGNDAGYAQSPVHSVTVVQMSQCLSWGTTPMTRLDILNSEPQTSMVFFGWVVSLLQRHTETLVVYENHRFINEINMKDLTILILPKATTKVVVWNEWSCGFCGRGHRTRPCLCHLVLTTSHLFPSEPLAKWAPHAGTQIRHVGFINRQTAEAEL